MSAPLGASACVNPALFLKSFAVSSSAAACVNPALFLKSFAVSSSVVAKSSTKLSRCVPLEVTSFLASPYSQF
jgi:hypothetical protein